LIFLKMTLLKQIFKGCATFCYFFKRPGSRRRCSGTAIGPSKG